MNTLDTLIFANNVIFVPLVKYFCKRRFSVSATIRLSLLSIATSCGSYRFDTTVIPFESHSAKEQRICGVALKVEVIVELEVISTVEVEVDVELVVEVEVAVDVEVAIEVEVTVEVDVIARVEVDDRVEIIVDIEVKIEVLVISS